ncbi:hypothetical protein LOAG_11897 [Loa loa]|uniref:Uncharacterized protein n=1 Tax=Loa loa TaxID=7209 RepID=A0A1S0TM71_LOALO|nr:hypothetical protein LOAG_11897 [Loa loa]EFO16608.1 hypothetical protein LOAG_11897 [Loa loa]
MLNSEFERFSCLPTVTDEAIRYTDNSAVSYPVVILRALFSTLQILLLKHDESHLQKPNQILSKEEALIMQTSLSGAVDIIKVLSFKRGQPPPLFKILKF